MSKIEVSAGFVILQDKKILLEHPTGSKWIGTYSIPKGKVEKGEDIFDAAVRETKEELGIEISVADLVSLYPGLIEYSNKGKVYKKIFYWIVMPSKRIDIDLSKLQKDEVDWAGFLTKEEAETKMFWRQKEILGML